MLSSWYEEHGPAKLLNTVYLNFHKQKRPQEKTPIMGVI